jgi:hypothetical protein
VEQLMWSLSLGKSWAEAWKVLAASDTEVGDVGVFCMQSMDTDPHLGIYCGDAYFPWQDNVRRFSCEDRV